jgi:peptidoglycan/xylan/chitin deacetylase (PgdA/CDA1 family)
MSLCMTSGVLSVLLTAGTLGTSVPAIAAESSSYGAHGVFLLPLQQWQEQSDRLAVERLDEAYDEGPMVRIARSGTRASGAIALTFDDGYDAQVCERVTDTLRAEGAIGTFFINGNWIKEDPDRWRRILEGMEVGNHTRSHRDLTTEPHPVVAKQILENEAIHERVLGRPMLKVLRPPYGAFSDRVRRIALELGYKRLGLWNVDTFDWKRSSSAADIIRRATGARAGSVILMHCDQSATAEALPKIIRHYQRRGLELLGLGEVLGMKHPYG